MIEEKNLPFSIEAVESEKIEEKIFRKRSLIFLYNIKIGEYIFHVVES